MHSKRKATVETSKRLNKRTPRCGRGYIPDLTRWRSGCRISINLSAFRSVSVRNIRLPQPRCHGLVYIGTDHPAGTWVGARLLYNLCGGVGRLRNRGITHVDQTYEPSHTEHHGECAHELARGYRLLIVLTSDFALCVTGFHHGETVAAAMACGLVVLWQRSGRMVSRQCPPPCSADVRESLRCPLLLHKQGSVPPRELHKLRRLGVDFHVRRGLRTAPLPHRRVGCGHPRQLPRRESSHQQHLPRCLPACLPDSACCSSPGFSPPVLRNQSRTLCLSVMAGCRSTA